MTLVLIHRYHINSDKGVPSSTVNCLQHSQQDITMKLVVFAVFALLAIASAVAHPSGILGVGVAPAAVIAAPAAVGIAPVGIAGGLGWGKAGVWG